MMRPHRALATLLVGVALVLPSVTNAAPVQCECVRYLREVMGVQIKGDAWTIRPNAETRFARAGDVLLTNEGPGHAALITGFFEPVEGDIWAKVTETNFSRCKPTTRMIRLSDKEVRGLYRPVIHNPLIL